jgi:hypothetical protein
MWPFLAAFAIAGSLLEALRRIEERLVGEAGPRPRTWTLRMPDQPHFAEPQQLAADIWAKNRAALDDDFWADLTRKRFILEQMGDGPSDN